MLTFGAGYLYGMRAGVQRHDEISDEARLLMESPIVRLLVDHAGEAVENAVGRIPVVGLGLKGVTAIAVGGQVANVAKPATPVAKPATETITSTAQKGTSAASSKAEDGRRAHAPKTKESGGKSPSPGKTSGKWPAAWPREGGHSRSWWTQSPDR